MSRRWPRSASRRPTRPGVECSWWRMIENRRLSGVLHLTPPGPREVREPAPGCARHRRRAGPADGRPATGGRPRNRAPTRRPPRRGTPWREGRGRSPAGMSWRMRSAMVDAGSISRLIASAPGEQTRGRLRGEAKRARRIRSRPSSSTGSRRPSARATRARRAATTSRASRSGASGVGSKTPWSRPLRRVIRDMALFSLPRARDAIVLGRDRVRKGTGLRRATAARRRDQEGVGEEGERRCRGGALEDRRSRSGSAGR